MKQLVAGGEDLTIVGIVQPKADASAAMLSSGIAYPAALTQHVIEEAKTSAIVQQQMADPTTNVLTGEPFGDSKGLVIRWIFPRSSLWYRRPQTRVLH